MLAVVVAVALQVRPLVVLEAVDEAAQVVQALKQVLLTLAAVAEVEVMPLIFILAQTAALAL
jgi:hypothetical protein